MDLDILWNKIVMQFVGLLIRRSFSQSKVRLSYYPDNNTPQAYRRSSPRGVAT